MSDIIVLAPNGRWSARQQTGVAAVNGFVFTYQNLTRIPKPTYRDPAAIVPNTNPIRLDSKGEANIYWEITDTYYTIEVYAANPTSPFIVGELLYSQDNYPAVNGTGGGDIIVQYLAGNLIRNAQFTFWGGTTYLLPSNVTPEDVFTELGLEELICDDWVFERNNTSANIQISRGHFFPGQIDVPSSPVNYLHYQSDTTGSGELFKAISQIYQSAQTFSGIQISVGLWAKSSISSTITVYVTQNFGTGGSPSAEVITPIFSQTLGDSWIQRTGTVVLPSVSGKSFGTNGNDYIKFSIGFPLNAIAAADIANVQFHGQAALPDFPYNTINDQYKHLDAVVNQGTSVTGDYLLSLQDTLRPGWIICNDQPIGNYYSIAPNFGNQYLQLYLLIWNTIPNYQAPIYDEEGALDVRGATALEDWNANKSLNLTRVLGRTLGAKGQPTMFQEFVEETIASTVFTAAIGFTSNLLVNWGSFPTFQTGAPCVLQTNGTLPSPLSTGTTYYLIIVAFDSKVKLATSAANAYAGIFIPIASAGTGSFSIQSPSNPPEFFPFTPEQQYVLSTASTANIPTGSAIELKTTGALPAPLLINTIYYVINISSTTFQLASTFENSQTNTNIVITTVGTGVQSYYDNPLLNLPDAYSFYTGTPVVLSTDGTLPTPLIAGVTYYSIYISNTSIKLASTYSNAITGVAIPLTGAGTGKQVMTITYDMNISNGEALGEFAHGLTPAESPIVMTTAGSAGGTNNFLTGSGESVQHNVVQPSFYTNCFLKL